MIGHKIVFKTKTVANKLNIPNELKFLTTFKKQKKPSLLESTDITLSVSIFYSLFAGAGVNYDFMSTMAS